jgi:KipI family sensor histidine kinase inhibitor
MATADRTAAEPRIVPFGDAAVLIVLGEGVDPAVNRRVHRLAARVRELAATEPGFGPPVPAYASLLVPVDPIEPGAVVAAARLARLVRDADAPGPDVISAGRNADGGPEPRVRPPIEIPVRYGGPDGPDLPAVAEATRLTEAEVIERHAGEIYDVWFLGFAPGFAYLGSVPEAIAVPRRPTPRVRVPAGSVGIAGRLTAVYPGDLPGGWQLLGRTRERLWDPRRDPPARLRPGDRVRFVPEP